MIMLHCDFNFVGFMFNIAMTLISFYKSFFFFYPFFSKKKKKRLLIWAIVYALHHPSFFALKVNQWSINLILSQKKSNMNLTRKPNWFKKIIDQKKIHWIPKICKSNTRWPYIFPPKGLKYRWDLCNLQVRLKCYGLFCMVAAMF